MKLRRVVTGFDAQGKAVVTSDGFAPEMDIPGGMKVSPLWGSVDKLNFHASNVIENGFPPGFDGDNALMNWGASELPPGMSLGMHGTRTVDFIVVLKGEVTCVLDTGSVITLGPHDVMVQRGTVHQWENRGTTPCAWIYAAMGRLQD